jgi:hypothetical protein
MDQTAKQRVVSLITDNAIQYYFNPVLELLGFKNSSIKLKSK